MRIAKEILSKKSKGGGTLHPDFKICYKAMVIKAVWYRPMEVSPCIYGQLIQQGCQE